MQLSRSEKLPFAVDFSLCNTVKMLSVRDCGILNSNGTPWPTAQGSGNIVEEKQTEWKSQRTEWSAVKCCYLDMVWLLCSWTQSSYAYLHKVKPVTNSSTEVQVLIRVHPSWWCYARGDVVTGRCPQYTHMYAQSLL